MKDVKKKLVSDVLDFDKYPSDINQFQSMLSDSEKEVIDGLKHRSNVDVEKNTKEVRERSAKLLNFLIKKLAEKDLPCLLDMTVEELSLIHI